MLPVQKTADESYTFFSPEFQETFHSHGGAVSEAVGKFVIPTRIATLAATTNDITLLDICYGLGYNSAAALSAIWQVNPQCHINLIALESNPEVIFQALADNLLKHWEKYIVELLSQLANQYIVETPQLSARLHLGDARVTIQKIQKTADAIFLDPFSPPKCPQLWSIEFLKIVASHLKKPEGILATYSCAAAVRKALQLAGLQISSSDAVGRKSPGTIATWTNKNLSPLTQKELEHLQTRAAVPYSDPHLQDDAATIIARRRKAQVNSDLEPSTHWYKRYQY